MSVRFILIQDLLWYPLKEKEKKSLVKKNALTSRMVLFYVGLEMYKMISLLQRIFSLFVTKN